MKTIELPTRPKIVKEENDTAILEVSPCYPGYGLTLGNALRRVLLSSLPGSAIIAIKVQGVSHEFSGIPHVLEDVIQIMLNFKKLRLKIFADNNEPIKMTLSAKGKKQVKAKDIKAPSNVEIINKDLLLATLTDNKANLDIEIEAQSGIGYSSAEEREKSKQEIGKILLDAIFTPVRRVNYSVENIRVGERTDFNKLILEIETDGTVTPKDAFVQATEILVDHFNVFVRPEKVKKEKKVMASKEKMIKKKKPRQPDLDNLTVEDLKLSARVISVLREKRIKGLTNLAKKSEEQLLEMDGLGEKAVKEIKREMGKLGLLLKQ